MNRQNLPFRDTSDCFLIYNNEIVAENHGHYIMFPGGGIDKGEEVIDGATREIVEETGAVLKKKLKYLGYIEWTWHPEWANNEKRKKRYEQFQGERSHFFFGHVDKFEKATSDEGDAFGDKKTMKINDIISILNKNYKKATPNNYGYIGYQIGILQMITLVIKNKSVVDLIINDEFVGSGKKKIKSKRNSKSKSKSESKKNSKSK